VSRNFRPFARAVRRGFTLIELLMVVTIILLLAGVFLSIRPGSGGGLPAAQKMLGSSLQSVRAMALMGRGSFASNVTYNGRYRLLILKDETDPVNHLRQFCIAIGSEIPPTGATASTTTPDTVGINYKWYAPEAPSILPPNVFFIPPLADSAPVAAITAPPQDNGAAGTWSTALGRRSMLPAIADRAVNSLPDAAGSPPMMKFEPVNQPTSLSAAPHTSGRTWYYVELQPSGASNHLGKVVLVLATGSARVQASGKVAIDCDNKYQFAAISVRPNGSISYTSDPDELEPSTTLYK
jgi:prepilin-type N-terminal cleavage/methylation domain-containing protein